MNKLGIPALVLASMISSVAIGQSAGPPEERVRGAYKMLLSETDTNKDGKISVTECKVIFNDPAMADKNCKFWDANNDGVITEDEYVTQVMSIGKKR